jgi:hypothetical protein
VVAAGLGGAEAGGGCEQGGEQGALGVARADGPRRDAVDAGVEKIESDVGAGKEIPTDEFLHDRTRRIVQKHDRVAVPADPAADVQQQAGDKLQNRADFVGEVFRGVEMPGVEADRLLVPPTSQKTSRPAPAWSHPSGVGMLPGEKAEEVHAKGGKDEKARTKIFPSHPSHPLREPNSPSQPHASRSWTRRISRPSRPGKVTKLRSSLTRRNVGAKRVSSSSGEQPKGGPGSSWSGLR